MTKVLPKKLTRGLEEVRTPQLRRSDLQTNYNNVTMEQLFENVYFLFLKQDIVAGHSTVSGILGVTCVIQENEIKWKGMINPHFCLLHIVLPTTSKWFSCRLYVRVRDLVSLTSGTDKLKTISNVLIKKNFK